MKTYSKLAIFAIFVIIICCLTTVSAADTNMTDEIAQTDTIDEDIVEASIDENVITTDENEEVIAEDGEPISDYEIEVEMPENMTACEDYEFKVILPEGASGEIDVYFQNEGSESTQITENNTAEFSYTPCRLGHDEITIMYYGNDLYAPKTTYIPIEISDYTIKLFREKCEYLPEVELYVVRPDDMYREITVTFNDEDIYYANPDNDYFITVTGLKFGLNNVTLYYPGDETFKELTVTQTLFTYNKNETKLIITPPETITAGKANNFTIEMNDNIEDDWVDLRDIEYDDWLDDIQIINGTGYLILNPNDVGNYSYNIYYSGNDEYKRKTVRLDFEVTDYIITTDDTYPYADEIEICLNVPESFSGDVEVSVNGEKYTATYDNSYTFTTNKLAVGDNTVIIYYAGNEKYHELDVGQNVTVYNKMDTPITITPPETIVACEYNYFKIDIPQDISQDLEIYYGDSENPDEYIYVEFGEGGFNYRPSDIGHYRVTVNFNGNRNYNANSTTFEFDVTNYTLDLEEEEIESSDSYQLHIITPDSFTGNVTVIINENQYTAKFENDYYFDVLELEIGESEVKIHYDGDENYHPLDVNDTLTVIYKEEPTMIITAPQSIVVGESNYFTVTMNDDIDYEQVKIYDPYVFNEEYYTTSGSIGFYYTPEQAGPFTLHFIYNGNDKYKSKTIVKEFEAEGYSITLSNTNCKYGTTTFYLGVPQGFENDVKVTVNGQEYTATYDGDYTLEITNLHIGDNEANIYYAGDEMFAEYSKDLNITVYAAIELPTYVTWNTTETISLDLPSDASGKLVISTYTYDENDEYSYTQIASVDMVNGHAEFPLNGLDVGYHNIYAEYIGDENYDAESQMEVITVRPTVTIPKYIIGDDNLTIIVKGYSENSKIEVYESTDYYYHEDYDTGYASWEGTFNLLKIVDVENGTTEIAISDLDSTMRHMIRVDYLTEYETIHTYQEVILLKMNVDLENNSYVIPNKDEVKVSFTQPVSGTLFCIFDGEESYSWLYNYDKVGYLFLPNPMQYGNHTVKVKLVGDEFEIIQTYNINVAPVTIQIPKKIAKNNEIYNSIVVYTPSEAKGTMTIYVDGEKYTSYNLYGSNEYRYYLKDVEQGYHDVEIVYSGDEQFNETRESATVYFYYANNIVEYYLAYGNDKLPVCLENPETSIIKIDGIEYEFTLDGNYAEVDTSNLDLGYYYVTIENNETGEKLYSTYIEVVGKIKFDSKKEEFSLILPENATGSLKVTVKRGDDTEHPTLISEETPLENGEAVYSIEYLNPGNHYIIAEYTGKDYRVDPLKTWQYENFKFKLDKNEMNVDEIAVASLKVNDEYTGSFKITVYKYDEESQINQFIFENITELQNSRANFEISDLTPGYYIISMYYEGNEYRGETDYLTVIGYDPELETEINEIEEGETANIKINLNKNATGKVTLLIDGKEVAKENANASLIIPIKKLTVGAHAVEIRYSGDDKFENDSVITGINVKKAEAEPVIPEININETEADEGETATIKVELPEDAKGLVLVEIDGKKAFAEVENGIATVNMDGLKADNYTAVVTYTGDDKYVKTTVTSSVKVKEVVPESLTPVTIDAKAADITEGETATINIDINATGIVYVEIDGKKLYAEIKDGKATVDIDGLTAGEKTATITYPENDKYTTATGKATFKVNEAAVPEPINPTINITEPEADEGETATIKVELPEDAKGLVLVEVDGKKAFAEVENGIATVNIDGLTPGNHTATITYTGDNKYNATTKTANVKVKEVVPEPLTPVTIDAKAADITEGETATINIDINATGIVYVEIDGKKLYTEINNGKATITVDGLTAGEKTATITYPENDKYTNATGKATFKVNEKEEPVIEPLTPATIKADVKEAYEGKTTEITVEAPKDATGLVLVTVEDKKVYAEIKDGKATVAIDGLKAGEHTAEITYTGDAKYNASTTTATVKVKETIPEPLTPVTIDAKADDITEGETATINININATGIVYLEIDGKKLYAEINNGKATITVDGLTAGEKTATITYPENDKYASATGSAKFKVNAKPVVPEKETADAKVTVPNTASPGDEPVVTLELPKDAAGNASVNVDGKEVANVPIVNGTASVPLKDLSTGAHVVEVAYTGDDKYAPASETKAIGVSDKSTPAPAKTKKDTIIDVAKSFDRVANDYYANERGAFFYAVLKDIDGNPLVNKTVSIAVNGPIYNVTTDDEGRAGLQVNFMVANFYTYALSFQGDDDYNAAPMDSSKLTITKKAMTITASSKTFKASAKKTISVTLKPAKNPYDGKEYLKKGKKVTLKVNGKTYTAKAKANGVAKFTIDLKKKGKYTAKINFAGDNTYSAAKKSIKLTIKQ